MPKITYVQPSGSSETFEVPVGNTVMQGAVNNNVAGVPAECGGAAACATCLVYVAPDWVSRLPPRQALEDSMLDHDDAKYAQLRLSCQVKVTEELDGLVVEVTAL